MNCNYVNLSGPLSRALTSLSSYSRCRLSSFSSTISARLSSKSWSVIKWLKQFSVTQHSWTVRAFARTSGGPVPLCEVPLETFALNGEFPNGLCPLTNPFGNDRGSLTAGQSNLPECSNQANASGGEETRRSRPRGWHGGRSTTLWPRSGGCPFRHRTAVPVRTRRQPTRPAPLHRHALAQP